MIMLKRKETGYLNFLHPVMSCDHAHAYERRLLLRKDYEWRAMQQAGRSVAINALRDFGELGLLPRTPRVLLLCGKGHNSGDALLAGADILRRVPGAEVHVLLSSNIRNCRTLTQEAYKELVHTENVHEATVQGLTLQGFDICIDGLVGMQFTPPLRDEAREILKAVNVHTGIRLRVAVDLPSGFGDEDCFVADFTYATGILKEPAIRPELASKVGRLRYLDLVFFQTKELIEPGELTGCHAISDAALEPLRGLRAPQCDKRSFGHLFVLAGSRSMPGALLMNVKAAVQSGAGLVTAFAPASVVSQFAAAVPEAMWVPWPETPEGGLALEGLHLLQRLAHRGTALLCGSGLGEEAETLELVRDLVSEIPLPVVLDADALRPEVIEAVGNREGEYDVTLTPHVGEFLRMSGGGQMSVEDEALREFASRHKVNVVLKGPLTRVCDGEQVAYGCCGGPVLARGGSGDILAGLIGGLTAQSPETPFAAACRGVVWHGKAADCLSRAHGQTAVRPTQLLDCLSAALREG